jgi:hypothetical protein
MDGCPPGLVDALAARRRVITFDNEGIRRTTLGPGTLTIGRREFTRAVDRFLRAKAPRHRARSR